MGWYPEFPTIPERWDEWNRDRSIVGFVRAIGYTLFYGILKLLSKIFG